MKHNLLVIVYTFLYCSIVYTVTLGQIIEKNDQTFYDLDRFVQSAVEKVGVALTLERNDRDVEASEFTEYLEGLDYRNIISLFLSNVDNDANSSCFRDLEYFGEELEKKDFFRSWAYQMLDSYGKPESGFLEGNLKWLGDYGECKNVYAPRKNLTDTGDFQGRYCSLGISLKVFPATIGLCLPDTCESSDFTAIIIIANLILKSSNITVSSLTCQAGPKTLSGGAIATIFIISIFLLLVFLGSFFTTLKYILKFEKRRESLCRNPDNERPVAVNDDTKECEATSLDHLVFTEGSRTKLSVMIDKFDPFLNCFCIFTNGSKLLSTDGSEGQLLCLHGIRFLSMSWVILCHVYMSPVAQLRSMKNLLPAVDNWPFQAILNGWYSVDSFFVLSGFLMSYLYFQEAAKKKGKTPWLYFYIHRYLRLTPAYMIVLAFFATITPFLGSGPFWPDYEVEPNCQQTWWWNLIYINNFQMDKQCMGWSWYLANDMQFFVISPLFLITLWRWPKIGFSILSLFLCGSWISSFVITYHYDLIAGSLSDVTAIALDQTFMFKWMSYMNKIYVKPYTRIAPYLIGIALGYIMFKRKLTNFKANLTTLWVGWLIAVPVGLYCVYGLYHQNPTLLGASFYNALTRTCYGLCLSWLIFVCLSGQGGPVDKILSYKFFIPLSRLTYSAYLIHPILIQIYVSSLKTTLNFTHQTMVLLFLGLITVTYALSILVSLTFESPLIRLEKLVRNKLQSSRQS